MKGRVVAGKRKIRKKVEEVEKERDGRVYLEDCGRGRLRKT